MEAIIIPYKDPTKMAAYMRERRAAKRDNKVNVNPVNPKPVNRKPVNPVNPNSKFSQISGSFEDGYWMGICPSCDYHNRMDPMRSYKPARDPFNINKSLICEHFQQLLNPGTASEFLFLTKVNKVNVNPVNRKPVNPVNPEQNRYLLSYSRNKYQYTLYRVSDDGSKMLIKSCRKGEKIMFGNAEVELTWGPEVTEVDE